MSLQEANINTDNLMNILLQTDDKDLPNLCSVNKMASEICKNNEFWRRKLSSLLNYDLKKDNIVDYKSRYKTLRNVNTITKLLQEAAKNGYNDLVILALNRGANIDNIKYILQIIIAKGFVSTLKLILDNGFNTNNFNNTNYLLYTVRYDRVDMLIFLLENNLSINLIDALKSAIIYSNYTIITILLKYIDYIPHIIVIDVIYSADVTALKLLLNYEVDIDINTLNTAVQGQNFEILTLLLNYNPDIIYPTLAEAILYDRLDTINILLKYVEISYTDLIRLLKYAISLNRFKIVEMLSINFNKELTEDIFLEILENNIVDNTTKINLLLKYIEISSENVLRLLKYAISINRFKIVEMLLITLNGELTENILEELLEKALKYNNKRIIKLIKKYIH